METTCRKLLWANLRIGLKRCQVGEICRLRSRRTLATSICLQAAKPSKPVRRKPPPKVPEYRSPTPRFKPQPAQNEPTTHSFRGRKLPLILGGTALFLFSSSLVYLIITMTRAPPTTVPTTPSTQPDVSARYNAIASTFDRTIDSTEYWMGMKSLRKKLASRAHGDVLEVSIGTGRNLEYYDWNFKGFNGVGGFDRRGNRKVGSVRSFTAVDQSPEMLEVAHEKFSKLFPGILGVRWVIADAAAPGSIPPPPRNADERSGNVEGGKYDTVVQTMGLCSVADPVALLRSLGLVVKEDSGRILLLEHGRGKWQWLNGALDRSAEAHAQSFGCWWNRDLKGIVEASGLEVVAIETPKWWHGGTTWWIELRKPGSGFSAEEGRGQGEKAGVEGREVAVKVNDTKVTVGKEVSSTWRWWWWAKGE